MYSKEEVVELFNDFSENYGRNSYKEFLKEKGLIEPELEIGKWYHYGTDLLVWNGGDLTYGFSLGVDYLNNAYFTVDNATPATDREVEEALIKEAKKRGFKEGVKFETLDGSEVTFENTKVFERAIAFFNDHTEMYENGGCFFKDGKWAEIIEDGNDTNVADIGNEITVNGITYTKKYRHC